MKISSGENSTRAAALDCSGGNEGLTGAGGARPCRRGDIVRFVDRHVVPDGTEGYSIEVFNALGDTTAVAATDLEPLHKDEILCARLLIA